MAPQAKETKPSAEIAKETGARDASRGMRREGGASIAKDRLAPQARERKTGAEIAKKERFPQTDSNHRYVGDLNAPHGHKVRIDRVRQSDASGNPVERQELNQKREIVRREGERITLTRYNGKPERFKLSERQKARCESTLTSRNEAQGRRDAVLERVAQERGISRKDVKSKSLSTADHGTWKAATYEVQEHSRKIGERVAANHLLEHYRDANGRRPERLHPRPSERMDKSKSHPHEFDQVWKSGDRIVVVEAKGGQGDKNTFRKSPDGSKLQQGSRKYFNSVVNSMYRTKEGRSLATQLRRAAKEGKVDYLSVETPIKKDANGRGHIDTYKVRRFTI